MTNTVVVRGYSDDLIDVSGYLNDEFPLRDQQLGDFVAFSDGTVLLVSYTDPGVWRIAPAAFGTASYEIVQAAGGADDDNYSDVVTLTGDIQWAVHGCGMAQR